MIKRASFKSKISLSDSLKKANFLKARDETFASKKEKYIYVYISKHKILYLITKYKTSW